MPSRPRYSVAPDALERRGASPATGVAAGDGAADSGAAAARKRGHQERDVAEAEGAKRSACARRRTAYEVAPAGAARRRSHGNAAPTARSRPPSGARGCRRRARAAASARHPARARAHLVALVGGVVQVGVVEDHAAAVPPVVFRAALDERLVAPGIVGRGRRLTRSQHFRSALSPGITTPR